MSYRWVEAGGDTEVAFSYGCDGQGHGRPEGERKCDSWDLPCRDIGYEHGHVVISCDDGIGWIPFPCASAEGVLKLVLAENHISPAVKAAVLQFDELRALPFKLTEGERAIFDDPERLERFVRFGYAS